MHRLTESEREVAFLVVQGLTNKEIGAKLYLSVHTIKSKMEVIYQKLGISNRVRLAVYVLKYLKDKTIVK